MKTDCSRRSTHGTWDARIALIERGRGGRLSDALRARVSRQMQRADREAEKARRDLAFPDQTEPGSVVRPARPAPRRRRSGCDE